jgi:hypothetical protein
MQYNNYNLVSITYILHYVLVPLNFAELQQVTGTVRQKLTSGSLAEMISNTMKTVITKSILMNSDMHGAGSVE